MIPLPAFAGFTKTLAAPHLPITSWLSVLPSTRLTVITFFSAALIAFEIAFGTSLAFPVPKPTLPFLSPTATVAVNLIVRPPLVVFDTRPIDITFSS